MRVKFCITKLPSRSKGWGRIKAELDGKPIIQSNTGNEWVSASKEADVAPGANLKLTVQECLASGKGRTFRKTITDYTYRLVAVDGQTFSRGDYQNGVCITVLNVTEVPICRIVEEKEN